MRKHTPIRDALPDKAVHLAHRLGDGLRHAPDGAGRWLSDVSGEAGKWLNGVPQGASQWLRAGVALGAARTGARAAGTVARRHPVALAAAAVGIGVALYAVSRHRRKKAEQAAFEGRRSQRLREAMERDASRRDAAQATEAEPLAGDMGIGPDR